MIRLNQNGSLDTSFGANGIVTWASPSGGADYANNLALQPDGRIVVAGASSTDTGYRIAVLRLLASGQPDTAFGQGGVVTYTGLVGTDAYPYGVIVQPNGRIVIAGSSLDGAGKRDAVVLGYTASGLPDPLFGVNGLFVFAGPGGGDDVASGLALQPDQAVAVTGYSTNGRYDAALTFRLK